MRKNAEINCLPKRCILRKIVCRDHLCYTRFGEFLKKLSAQPEWRKKTCKRSIDGGKNFRPPRNHEFPLPPAKNNGPSLRRSHKSSSGKALYFRSYQPKTSRGWETPPSAFRINVNFCEFSRQSLFSTTSLHTINIQQIFLDREVNIK